MRRRWRRRRRRVEVEYGRTALGVSGGAGGGGDAGGEAGICEKNSSQNTAGTSRQDIKEILFFG